MGHKFRKSLNKINKTVTRNVLFSPSNSDGIEKEMLAYFKTQFRSFRKNQIILLMITDVEKWHYLTLKILSKLLHGNTSKQ